MRGRSAFALGGQQVEPGSRSTIDLPVSVLSDHTPATLSVHVIHGKKPGPTLFVSAAVHGDEVIGVEIVRRLLRVPNLDNLAGTLIAVPIVNAFGFLNRSRYLPDRRDLNRSFPGSPAGSLAFRLAHLFVEQIVKRCDVGIDIHSAAIHRTNLPQIRVAPGNPDTMALAEAFAAPLILHSKLRDGSLRQAARQKGVEVLLYEAGEGLRFDEGAARIGVTGILRVMRHLGMIPGKGISRPKMPPVIAHSSLWQRAPAGGLLRTFRPIGETIRKDDLLGVVSDPFGEVETEIFAEEPGLLIGRTNLPVVNEGDGLFHIARLRSRGDADAALDSLTAQLEAAPLFDEDEII